MRNKMLTILIVLQNITVGAQEIEIKGVINDISISKSFGEGSDAIKSSILNNAFNLNLYEYANSLNELYELLNSSQMSYADWDNYIDKLLIEVEAEKIDTIPPFYVSEYNGIIPLQAECFLLTLELNDKLKNKYPSEYEKIKSSASRLVRKGYSIEVIDTILTCFPINSTIGTVNFWIFLQVIGCPIIDLGIKKEGEARLKILLENLEIVSTYKTPYILQKRKLASLLSNLDCQLPEIRSLIEKRSIAIYDKKKEAYFEENLREGVDIDLIKEF